MSNKLIGILLLASFAIFYVLKPYYPELPKMLYQAAELGIIVFGVWAGVKLAI